LTDNELVWERFVAQDCYGGVVEDFVAGCFLWGVMTEPPRLLLLLLREVFPNEDVVHQPLIASSSIVISVYSDARNREIIYRYHGIGICRGFIL